MFGISDLGRYVSGACAAVAILAGCDGVGGAQVAPAVPAQHSHVRSTSNAVQPTSIVYTPVNETIKNNGSLGLDLNNDETNDFTFKQHLTKYEDSHTGQPCGYHFKLSLSPSQSANGIADGAHVGWAATLLEGHRINSKLTFYQSSSLLADVSWDNGSPFCFGVKWDYGYWWDAGVKYIGLEFQVQGQTHYGWAQVSSNSDRGDNVYTTLTGYAYQTTAGKSISAGQTK
jgi:hypothetical protein